jgi:hypothetical protein
MANATKQVRVWEKAHTRLGELSEKFAREKGLDSISFVDAASIAIIDALEKCEHPEESRDYYTIVTMNPGEESFVINKETKIFEIFRCHICDHAIMLGELEDAQVVKLSEETATVEMGVK